LTEVLEELISFYFQLRGYFTLTRIIVPCGESSRGLSDFDVIAYDRNENEVVIVECKGWGSPEEYPSFDTPGRLDKLRNIAEKIIRCWNSFVKSQFNKYNFTGEELRKIIIVIPGKISSGNRSMVISSIQIEIKPIHEVILDIINTVKEDMYIRRKRYWNPALEMIRWIIRALKTHALTEKELIEALQI